MFVLIKKMFVILLISVGNAYNHINCISLTGKKCMTQRTFINLCPNEYELLYYPFAVNLHRYVGICIILMTYLIGIVF